MPQAWKDALNAAVQAGKIPNVPISSGPNNSSPVYPPGINPNSPEICSATYKCKIPDDIWDAPEGMIGISFDDGPLPVSGCLSIPHYYMHKNCVNAYHSWTAGYANCERAYSLTLFIINCLVQDYVLTHLNSSLLCFQPSYRLYSFLQSNNVKATHFFIGVNIIMNPQEFLIAVNVNEDDIAVHTWTHPHMTTLSNEDVVAQLAWSMELIHNSTGGRVPRFWRPPYGDTDVRVSAIAKEVLGLTTILWNRE